MITQHTVPVAIGGIGGSGTRLIAKILNELGFHIGSDLNEAYDNLLFTLLFKRHEVLSATEYEFDLLADIFEKSMTGAAVYTNEQINFIEQLSSVSRLQHSKTWLEKRAENTLTNRKDLIHAKRWGWKEPNTHIVIDRLAQRYDQIKYIHVMRNGLDMAYSENQNQLKLWGEFFLKQEFEISPYFSLQYWCLAHKRIIEIGKSFGNNFLLLDYDSFCLEPKKGISCLLNFLEISPRSDIVENIQKLIKIPTSIGRFKQYDLHDLDPQDIQYVESLGFDNIT